MKRTLALILIALTAFAAVVCWGGKGFVAHADDPQFTAAVKVGLASDGELYYGDTARLYADIQIALTQGETIDVAPVATLGDWDEYNQQSDIVFTGDTAPCVELPLHKGTFAVFFPWDAHKPCLGEGTTKKIVVKVFMG